MRMSRDAAGGLLSRVPVLDALVALALAVGAQVAIWTGGTDEGPRHVTAATALLLTLPLAWRRTATLGAAVAWSAGALAQAIFADSPSSIWALAGVLLLSFSIGEALPLQRAVLVGTGFVAVVWVMVILQPDSHLGDELFTAPLLAGGPLVVGVALHKQQERSHRIAREAVEREREQEQRARDAIAAERNRIARELHDVVAHGVSVMVVQAGAAEQLMGSDHDRAAGALAAVRDTGKESLAELRRMLNVLRMEDGDAQPREPQPGLDDLNRLAETHRAAGLEVQTRLVGRTDPLPAGLDLAAFRVVQEALTNVRKHAGPHARAVVTITHEPTLLTVAILDDGIGTTVTHADGHGLVGMRERVGLYDGVLCAGPARAAGWQVVATFPMADSAAASRSEPS